MESLTNNFKPGTPTHVELHLLWLLTSTYSNDHITSSMGDELVFIFKEKFDRPVTRSSTLVKILQYHEQTKTRCQNNQHLVQ